MGGIVNVVNGDGDVGEVVMMVGNDGGDVGNGGGVVGNGGGDVEWW